MYLTDWFGGLMIRLADISSRFTLHLLGIGLVAVASGAMPGAAPATDYANATAGQVTQAVAQVDVMHNGVRVTNLPVMKTVAKVAELNPGPIDQTYPRASLVRLVQQLSNAAARDVAGVSKGIMLPCRGVACTGIQP